MLAIARFIAFRKGLEDLVQLKLHDKEKKNLLKSSIMNVCVYYGDSLCSESSPFPHILDSLVALFIFLVIFHLLDELQVLYVTSR